MAKADIFTTGQAAKVCGVSIRTLKRWLERGELAGYRLPSGEWRIPRADLVRFMDRHAIPLTRLEPEEPRRRILMVEEDPRIIEPVQNVLSRDGRLELQYATSGYQACLKAGLFRPDLVVIGLRGPSTDGFGLARLIRQTAATRHAKILLTNASADPESIQEMEAVGDGYLLGPTQPEALVEAIYRLAGLARPGEGAKET